MDHGHLHDSFPGFRQPFVIFAQAPVAIEPAEGALHNPALRNDHKPLDGGRALRHRQADRPVPPQGPDPVHQRPGIGLVRPDVPSPSILVLQALQQRLRPVAVLHTGGRDDDGQDQPAGIDQDRPLAPLDLCTRVATAEPPVSVVLTD
jgi:hypothetical protein